MESFSSITISRTYFDTLIRRCNFNPEPEPGILSDPTTVAASDTAIVVLESEYDNLKVVARQYANLRQNLLNGGVTEPTITLLSSDESMHQQDTRGTQGDIASFADYNDHQHDNQDQDLNGNGNGHLVISPVQSNRYRPPRQQQQRHMSASAVAKTKSHDESGLAMGRTCVIETVTPVAKASVPEDAALTAVAALEQPSRPQYERMATRTILLYDLADNTTHADITDAVRGGMLVDIYLRNQDRSVQVSFLHTESAEAFFNHVRRHGLYIRQRRVSIKWSERQFVLAGHVANKIRNGATRNLVIRRCDPKVTAKSIREDLDHIHSLVVVRVTFVRGSCFIQTNSVNNAIFARTCMMSRYKYKRSKIEWDADACVAPLDTAVPVRAQVSAVPTKRALNPMANRFQLLDLDGASGDDTDDDDAPGFQPDGSARMVV